MKDKKDLCSDFIDFDVTHPKVYKMFSFFTTQALNANYKQFGAKMVMERIRWETYISKDGQLRFANQYTAFYARKFEFFNPQFKGIFRMRKSVADQLFNEANFAETIISLS